MRFKIAVLTLLVWISAVTVATWDFIHVQRFSYQFDALESVGLAGVLLGFSLRNVAKRTLRSYLARGADSLRKHKLVKHGVYAYIRHPIYLGAILLNLGAILLFSSPYGFLIMLGFVPCILYRIKIEEKSLVKKFGREYKDYMKTTKKIIPFIY